jgi:hypothetical protein
MSSTTRVLVWPMAGIGAIHEKVSTLRKPAPASKDMDVSVALPLLSSVASCADQQRLLGSIAASIPPPEEPG